MHSLFPSSSLLCRFCFSSLVMSLLDESLFGVGAFQLCAFPCYFLCPVSPESSRARAPREIYSFQVVVFQVVPLNPSVCCFPVPFHPFPFLWHLFPALPFATFFSVFPFAFSATLPAQKTSLTLYSAGSILTVPFSWSFPIKKLLDTVYTCYLHMLHAFL